MATRNTPTTSTLEEWRVEFNELATDVGNVTGSSQGDQLTTSATDIVGAINELETNFNAFVAGSTTAADNISTGDGAVNITTSSGNITIDAAANNTDIIFKGTDATADITMLTLDGSEAGAATFNSAITGGGLLTTGGNIVIPDAGNIGSASDTNAITISSGGVVAVTATTASSNSTTGALTVGGGAGVAADLSVGDDLRLISDSAVLSFGADSDTTLTHTDGTGLTLNSTNKLTFGDAATFIHQSSNGVMTIDGEATIDLNASTAVLVSNDLKLNSDSSVLGFGADNDTTLTHTDGSGLTLNSTNKLMFNDASQFIQGASATVLDIAATDEIELNATLVDANANLDVSGTYTGGGLMTTGGNIVIPDAGNIGSASDTDAIAIASTGIVTFSQNPVGTGAINNMIINGDMVVAQRGITITDAQVDSVSTTTNADDSYTLDRWILLSDGDDIVDVKQTSTSPNDGSSKALQLEVETADKKFGIVQIIENVNCHDAIGTSGRVSLSFKMKASDASIDDVRAAVVSWSGTADSVTSDIVNAWEAEGTNPTLITNATYENTPANLSPTTSFAEYKIENILVDTSSTGNLLVFIWSGVTDVEVNDSLFITDVQLESGAAANPFVRKPIQQTILDCERYYETSLGWGDDSAFQGQQVKFGCGSATYNASTDAAAGNRFNTRKRTTPTVTLYHQDGTSGAVYTIHNAAKITGVVAQHITDMGYLFANKSSGFNSGIGYYYAHIVEAEL